MRSTGIFIFFQETYVLNVYRKNGNNLFQSLTSSIFNFWKLTIKFQSIFDMKPHKSIQEKKFESKFVRFLKKSILKLFWKQTVNCHFLQTIV